MEAIMPFDLNKTATLWATRLRDTLHQVFVYGTHATAVAPLLIQPLPPIDPWIAIKAGLLEGDDLRRNKDGSASDVKHSTLAMLLDNTSKHLAAHPLQGPHHRPDITLPLLRRMLPRLIAFDLVGVQPIARPLEYIHTLRVRFADTKPDTTGTPFTQVVKASVGSQTYKYLTSYQPPDNAADAFDDLVLDNIANELGSELDQHLIAHLYGLAGPPSSTFDSETAISPVFIGDTHASLAILINRQANLIASRTRRGAGNWCLVSPTALTILQSATTSAFAPSSGFDRTIKISEISFAGTLNNSVRVYLNPHAHEDIPILVGYKGSSEMDAPVMFCPYLPVISGGVIIEPSTFKPKITFIARNATHTLENTLSSLGNAADYLGAVGIRHYVTTSMV